MRLLITGSTGFLGRRVLAEAIGKGHDVVATIRSTSPAGPKVGSRVAYIQCDLASADNLSLEGLGIDAVIHLAASMHASCREQYRSTVNGTRNLLAAMRRSGVKRIVLASSLSVLDYGAVEPGGEINETVPVHRNNAGMGRYASMKAKQEALIASFATEPGSHCTILRPGLIYDESHLIPAHAGILKGPLRLFVKHDGEVPVVWVGDVAQAVVAAVEQDIPGGKVLHLVGDNLPSQQQYLAGLRRRGILSEGGVHIGWKTLHRIVTVLRTSLRLIGMKSRLPEIFLEAGFVSRMKPFKFSNARAKEAIKWRPEGIFS